MNKDLEQDLINIVNQAREADVSLEELKVAMKRMMREDAVNPHKRSFKEYEKEVTDKLEELWKAQIKKLH